MKKDLSDKSIENPLDNPKLSIQTVQDCKWTK